MTGRTGRGQRIIVAAAQAAIDEARATPPPKRRSIPAGRALLLGAGVMTAGRLVAGPRARELLSGLADRLEALEDRFAVDGREDPS